MDKKFCIFDMDGTLIDSMGYWDALGQNYLLDRGIRPREDVLQRMKVGTLTESACWFIEEFGIPGPPERIVREFNEIMAGHYRSDIPLKEGVADCIQEMKAGGVKLAVASATALPLIRECLERLEVARFFDVFASCESIGRSKEFPDVYLEAARQLGCAPEECAVFEDSLFAARTAKQAGFYTVGVYELSCKEDWPAMQELCHETIRDWRTPAFFSRCPGKEN